MIPHSPTIDDFPGFDRQVDNRLKHETLVLHGILDRPEWLVANVEHLEPSLFDHPTRRHLAVAAMELADERGTTNLRHVSLRAIKNGARESDVCEELRAVFSFSETHPPRDETLDDSLAQLRKPLLDSDLVADIQHAVTSTTGGHELVRRVEGAVETFKGKKTPTADALVTLADIMQTDPSDEKTEGVRTGLAWFDSHLPTGSLQRGDKLMLGGRPGVGKTALAIQTTLVALYQNPGLNAVWCAGEMSNRQLRNRAIQCWSGLPLEILKRPWSMLSPLQEEKKRKAIEVLEDLGQRLRFVPSPLRPSTIDAAVRSTSADWLVCDYLQLMRPDEPTQDRRTAVDSCLFELVRMTNAYGLVLLCVSDSPKPQHGSVPDIFSGFKESSEIGYAADLAYYGLMSAEDEANEDAPDNVFVTWKCLKARHGSPQSIRTRFDRAAQQFREPL